MSDTIRFGFSTCPNDTFAYHALLSDAVDTRGLRFDCELLDVQELNERLARGDFDVAKVSFHAAVRLARSIVVLPVGSALGFGVGPLLLAAEAGRHPREPRDDGAPARVLCPGEQTTATLLYRLFHSGEGRVEQTVFDRIMPALQSGEADFGVCIHEGRFTYEREGLACVEDLGERWERETSCPLPLGGIVARAGLGADRLARVTAVLRDSLDVALVEPAAALPTMRRYAQELDDDVIRAHVDLYVNDWTRDLGETGRRALDELSRRAVACGAADDRAPLRIFRDEEAAT